MISIPRSILKIKRLLLVSVSGKVFDAGKMMMMMLEKVYLGTQFFIFNF